MLTTSEVTKQGAMPLTDRRILTVPAELPDQGELALTGNEFVSVPVIDPATGAVQCANVLHMGQAALIEFHGDPLLQPALAVNGAPVQARFDSLEYESYFIPFLQGQAGPLQVGLRYCAPPGFKGFAVELTVVNRGPDSCEVNAGLAGSVTGATAAIFSRRPLSGPHRCYFDTWTRAAVFEANAGTALAAFAVRAASGAPWRVDPALPWSRETGGGTLAPGTTAAFAQSERLTLAPGAAATVHYFCGVGREGDGAGLNAVDLARHGWASLYAQTRAWLDARARPAPDDAVAKRMNRNLFFSLFFAAGRTIDTEELVLVTSRSPRYYVSAAHWSRDSLLWAFPATLLADQALAREQLVTAFRLYTRNVGLHALYMDGAVLYPGFELDEVCAFVIALARYVQATGDRTVLAEPSVKTGLEHVLAAFAACRHAETGLGRTFLLSTDDPAPYPYVTYSNALLSLSWRLLGDLFGADDYRQQAEQVREAVFSRLVVPGPFGPMFCGAADLAGRHALFDEPPGSLELLAHYGFVTADDPVYRNTVAWIYSEHNPHYRSDGRWHTPECVHAPHPWVLALANGLLSGRDLVGLVVAAPLDSGFACETIDRDTGRVKTGAAFATCAGFLAYALDFAVNRPLS